MKSIKKIISVFLAALCIFTIFSMTSSVSASDILEDIIGETIEPDIDERFLYGIHYEIDSFSGVNVVYKPNPDIEMQVPSKVQVSSNFPLAIDYECYAWKDDNGVLYYPGEYILCEGKVTLYAVWTPKTDNDPRAVRAIKTGFQALIQMIKEVLGFFEVINHFEYEPTTTKAPTTTTLIYKTTAAA